MSIFAEINSKSLVCLLDSGAQASLISLEITNKFFPDWKSFPDVHGPQGGQGVNGDLFDILGTKLYTLKVETLHSEYLCQSQIFLVE